MTASEPSLSSLTMETSRPTSVSMATADVRVTQDIVQPAPESPPTQPPPDTHLVVAMEPGSLTLTQLVTMESETSVQEEGLQLSAGPDPTTSPEKVASVHGSGQKLGAVTFIDALDGAEDQDQAGLSVPSKEEPLEDLNGGGRGNVTFEEEPLEDPNGGGRGSVTFEEEPLEDRNGRGCGNVTFEEELLEDPNGGGRGNVTFEEEPLEDLNGGGRGNVTFEEEPMENLNGEGRGDVMFTEEPLEGVEDLTDYSGSIMQSEDSIAATQRLDLSEVLEALSSDIEPSSPVLPTTMETIFVEEEEDEEAGQEESELLSFSSNELEESNLDELEEAAARSRSISESLPEVTTVPDNEEPAGEAPPTQEVTTAQEVVTTTQEVVTTTTQEVAVPREGLPQRRPSPYPTGEAEVKEALYTAWLPSPWTQELLANPPPGMTTQHLTCPGLVADSKMVRLHVVFLLVLDDVDKLHTHAHTFSSG